MMVRFEIVAMYATVELERKRIGSFVFLAVRSGRTRHHPCTAQARGGSAGRHHSFLIYVPFSRCCAGSGSLLRTSAGLPNCRRSSGPSRRAFGWRSLRYSCWCCWLRGIVRVGVPVHGGLRCTWVSPVTCSSIPCIAISMRLRSSVWRVGFLLSVRSLIAIRISIRTSCTTGLGRVIPNLPNKLRRIRFLADSESMLEPVSDRIDGSYCVPSGTERLAAVRGADYVFYDPAVDADGGEEDAEAAGKEGLHDCRVMWLWVG